MGNVGEAYVLAKLVELGFPVYQQFGDNEPADYIVLVEHKPLKVQVKASDSYNFYKGELVDFSLTSSVLTSKNGVKKKDNRHYTTDEVDAFILYDIVTQNIFLLQNNGKMSRMMFRYVPPPKRSSKLTHFATDYLLTKQSLIELSKSL